MAIKRRFVECECGELFTEGKNNQLEGATTFTPWKLKDNRKRNTKMPSGSEILIAIFERSVFCEKCKQELLREKRQYELTPPTTQNDEPVTSYSSREFVFRVSNTKPSESIEDSDAVQKWQAERRVASQNREQSIQNGVVPLDQVA